MRSQTISAFGKLFLFLLVVMMIFAFGATWRDRVAPPASDPDRGTISENETPAPSPTIPVQADEPDPGESTERSGVQRQVAAGLAIETSNLRFEEEEAGGVTLKLDICIPMPTDADWFIHAANLRFAGTVVEDHGTIPIEIVEVHDDGTAAVYTFENNRPSTSERPALENEQSHRCDTLYFWGQPEEVRDAELVITIDGLYASRLTGEPCTNELLARAQQEMDSLAAGIVLACTADLENGYAGLAIERIPEEMSREAADVIFYSDAFYLAMFGVAGPWVFVYPETNEQSFLTSPGDKLQNLELAESLLSFADQPVGFVVSQAQALINLFAQQPANNGTPWLHLVWKDQDDDTRVFVMPENGTKVHAGPISEGWFQLDNQGRVLSSVNILRDIHGNPLQISSSRDGVGRNHTLGLTSADEIRPFDQFLTAVIKNQEGFDLDELIQVSEESYNGRFLVFFSAITEYDRAEYWEDLGIWVLATERHEGYDPETGIRMVSEYVAITPSGQRIVWSKGETILIEWLASPPGEVLDILAEEVGH